MFRRFVLVGVVMFLGAVMLIGTGVSQEKKNKGRLPNNWKGLGLSEMQKEKIYVIMANYKEKIELLEKQLEETRGKQTAEMVTVLTDPQKERLRKLLLGELGTEPKK